MYFALIMTLVLTACGSGGGGSSTALPSNGGGNGGGSSPTANSQFNKLVVGYLYTDTLCSNNNIAGTSTKAYFTRVNDTDWAFEKDYWSGLNCNTGTILYTTKLIKRFISSVPLAADSSFDEINHSVVSFELMILDSSMLNTYNSSSYYTYNNWQMAEYKSIACKKPQTNSPYTEVCAGDVYQQQFKVDESFTPFKIYYANIYEFQ